MPKPYSFQKTSSHSPQAIVSLAELENSSKFLDFFDFHSLYVRKTLFRKWKPLFLHQFVTRINKNLLTWEFADKSFRRILDLSHLKHLGRKFSKSGGSDKLGSDTEKLFNFQRKGSLSCTVSCAEFISDTYFTLTYQPTTQPTYQGHFSPTPLHSNSNKLKLAWVCAELLPQNPWFGIFNSI